MAAGCNDILPGSSGMMSLIFLFILIGVVELSLAETLLIAWAATIFQSFWRSKTRPMPVQILFNAANVTLATSAAYHVYHLRIQDLGVRFPILLVTPTSFYFL